MHSWRKGWQCKIEIEEIDWTKWLSRIKHSTLFPNFDDQLCNWSTIQLPRNGAKCKCKLLTSCQAQMQAPRLGKRVVQDNALKSWGTLTWMFQLSQKGVFKWSWCVLSMPWKSLENKEDWWEICHFTSTTKKIIISIASPTPAYLDKKCNRSQGRPSIGWQGSLGTE